VVDSCFRVLDDRYRLLPEAGGDWRLGSRHFGVSPGAKTQEMNS
jgi:hypothetical protein